MTESHVKPPIQPEEKPAPQWLLTILRPIVRGWQQLRRAVNSLAVAWFAAILLGFALLLVLDGRPLPQALPAGPQAEAKCPSGDRQFIGAVNQPATQVDVAMPQDANMVTIRGVFDTKRGTATKVTIETSQGAVSILYTYSRGDQTKLRWVTPSGQQRIALGDGPSLTADTAIVVCVGPDGPR